MDTIINKKLPLPAEYKEKIKRLDVDSNDPDYFDGFVPFTYDVLEYKQEQYNPIAGLSKTRRLHSIKSYDGCPFKTDDIIRLWGIETYKIESVTWEIEEKFKKTVARFPKAWKKYAYKRIVLK